MRRISSLLFLALLLPLFVLTSCQESEPDNQPGGETPNPEVQLPNVTLSPVGSTDESLTFTISPEYATSVRYAVYQEGETLPTVEELLTAGGEFSGNPADATAEDTYTVSSLSIGTDYVVVAAASNPDGYSQMATLEMTTTIPEVSVSIQVGEVNSNDFTFTISPVNASEVKYLVFQNEAPAADEVMEMGVDAELSEHLYNVTSLEPATTYSVVAAAKALAGEEVVLSDILVITTDIPELLPPSVGDFYYSDGTWSKELDSNKTPIAVVFYVGAANEFSDNAAFYKTKAGESMDQITGYAVALKDASDSEGVWWSFYDSWAEATGVSTEVDDFLGYTNTLAIKTQAEKLGVGFSDSNESYPAAYLASDGYESLCPAPASSSGWFLPAAGQLQYIWDQVYFNPTGNLIGWVENSFEKLGDQAAQMHTRDSEYWSSTEQVDSYATSVRAYYVCYDSSNFQPGFTAWYNKNTNFRVRSILVF